MLILIEGCDGTGKSTLARELNSFIGYSQDVEMLARGVPQASPLEEYVFSIKNYEPGCNRTLICDRWHVGADVYGPIMRGDQGLDATDRVYIESFLRSRGALLVHVSMSDTEALIERLRARGEDYLPVEKVSAVMELFSDVVRKSDLPRIDFYDGNPLVFPVVRDAVTAETRALTRYGRSFYQDYVGPSNPTVIFADDGRSELPFLRTHVVDDKFDCKLDPVIRSLRIDRYTGFATARYGFDRIWDELRRPPVIALNEKALSMCRENNIPCSSVLMEDS